MYRIRNCGGTLTLHEPEASGPKSQPRPAETETGKAEMEKEQAEKDTRGSVLLPGIDGIYRYASQRALEEAEGREKLAKRKAEYEADELASTLPYFKQRQRLEKKLGLRGT